jgi:hypothetical protein
MPAPHGRRVLALLVVLLLSSCALFRAPKATVEVEAVAAAFPTIERLEAVVYMHEGGSDSDDPECEYFEYGRGAFTSNPADEFCRVFDFDDRHPGGGMEGPVPVAFDDQARAHLAELLASFDGVGAPLDYMNLVLAPDGSVGADSGFSFDRCVSYWYQPGWTTLPEDIEGDSVSSGMNADWYKTDSCP